MHPERTSAAAGHVQFPIGHDRLPVIFSALLPYSERPTFIVKEADTCF